MRIRPLFLLGIYVLVGCGGPSVAPAHARADAPAHQAGRAHRERARRSVRPRPAPTEELREAARGSNVFAMDLYARLRARDGNFAFSPASISIAMAMTYAGARGQTATQMARTLHFGENADRLHTAYRHMLTSWRTPGRPYELRVANRLFGQQGVDFAPGFVTVTRDVYDAPIEPMDFARSDSARAHINAWVASQTRDRIRELLGDGSITASTRLVLANAVYFKGRWAREFEVSDTRPAPFSVAPSQRIEVPTMHLHEAPVSYASLDGVSVLEMPYVGGDLAMTIVLPDAPDGLRAVEERMNAETFDRWIGALREGDVNVALPRFRIEAAESMSLGRTLAEMGMPDAFDARRADFSGMGEADLAISDVMHKAFVEVNEEGTEAAAATGVTIVVTSARMVPTFTADHPFLFFIRDRTTGGVMFVGRVVRPS